MNKKNIILIVIVVGFFISAFNTLFLLTNKDCEAAIHLYEKNGFTHCADIMDKYGSAYERCNVAMRYIR